MSKSEQTKLAHPCVTFTDPVTHGTIELTDKEDFYLFLKTGPISDQFFENIIRLAKSQDRALVDVVELNAHVKTIADRKPDGQFTEWIGFEVKNWVNNGTFKVQKRAMAIHLKQENE